MDVHGVGVGRSYGQELGQIQSRRVFSTMVRFSWSSKRLSTQKSDGLFSQRHARALLHLTEPGHNSSAGSSSTGRMYNNGGVNAVGILASPVTAAGLGKAQQTREMKKQHTVRISCLRRSTYRRRWLGSSGKQGSVLAHGSLRKLFLMRLQVFNVIACPSNQFSVCLQFNVILDLAVVPPETGWPKSCGTSDSGLSAILHSPVSPESSVIST